MNSEPDVVLKVEGMMCQNNCGTTVQKALSNVPKVTKVVVSFAKKEAQIWGSVSSSVLINAVASVGFDATVVMQQQPTANGSGSSSWFVHTIESKEEFEEELGTWPGLLIVKFEAEWCGPCKDITPFVQEMAKNHPLVRFLKVDTDEHDELMHRYQVTSLPYFLFFKSGHEIDKVVGAHRDELVKKVQLHQQQGGNVNSKPSPNPTPAPVPATPSLPFPLPEHEFFDVQFPDHDQWNLGMVYESRKFAYRIVRQGAWASEPVSAVHPAVTVNALFVTVQG